MGNYLIRQDKMIIKANDEALEYTPLIKVDILPPPVSLPESVKNQSACVRIKLVVSKLELEVMLKKGGVSMDDLVSHIGKSRSLIETDDRVDEVDGKWKPCLESIPETS